MTTRGNLYPCLPPPPIPLLLAKKKKKRSIFDSTSSKQSNRSRNADYFVDYYFSRRHWIVKKKKKNTNSWSSRSRRMRFAIRWLNGNWIIGHDDRSGGSGAHPVWQAGVWKIHRGGGSINVEQRCFLETLSISGGWHLPSPPKRSTIIERWMIFRCGGVLNKQSFVRSTSNRSISFLSWKNGKKAVRNFVSFPLRNLKRMAE